MSQATARPSARTRLVVWAIVAALLAASVLVPASGAHAAARGSGFGAWAPVSPYGWHGSMLVDGVHTYCILPGAAAPTGPTTDRGVRTTVDGLTAKDLTGINLLVTKYGQTGDPVKAAAVAWAVKAIADWDAALHHYGYRGDSLAGAVNWTFSALAPTHNAAVQKLAVAYYDEAKRVVVGSKATGELVFTTDPSDHRLGTVAVRSTVAGASGSITLTGAVFVGTGASKRTDVVPGAQYAIRTTAGAPGRPQIVRGSARLSAGPAAAVLYFTTPGGQTTAGPGGSVVFEATGADAAPRSPGFSPVITTQVGARYSPGGPFVDDVTMTLETGEWPRTHGGRYLVLAASATVYRTDEEPAPAARAPSGAVVAGRLRLLTDPAVGPGATYRVVSDWKANDPGFYTAVWTIRADAQSEKLTAARLPEGYVWTERFGVPGQITMVPDVSSRAQPSAIGGQTVTDTIVVDGPIPSAGLEVASSLYHAAPGAPASESCVSERLVWSSPAQHVDRRGDVTVTGPAVTEPGTYYWQERAVDADGVVVHLGTCGIEHETTEVAPPPPPPTPSTPPTPAAPPTAPPAPPAAPPTPSAPPQTPPTPPPAPTPSPTSTHTAPSPSPSPGLAQTGGRPDATRAIAGIGITALTLGATLLAVRRRRRFEASPSIG